MGYLNYVGFLYTKKSAIFCATNNNYDINQYLTFNVPAWAT